MKINTEVSIGDILTVAALTLTVVTILIAWRKDRSLKLREYATPIRHSAGLIIAKMGRWRVLSSQFFDDIQPILTDADGMITANKPVTEARDSLWRNLVAARALYNQKILNEQIEMAFSGLYGYNPGVQALFGEAMEQLQSVDKAVNEMLLELTQLNVLRSSSPGQSAKLGNELRKTSILVSRLNESLMDQIIDPFYLEMTKLIKASDQELADKRVIISDPREVFPSANPEKIKLHKLALRTLDRRQQLWELCERYPRDVSALELLKYINLPENE